MSFKKNTAVPGFSIGVFRNVTTGTEVTEGDPPTCTRLLDGVGGSCANAAEYDATAGVWKIDLAAADMNADLVGLKFALTDCISISYTIKTYEAYDTNVVSVDDVAVSAEGDVAQKIEDLEARLTAARAGYLDKLDVTGTLAHSDAANTYKADVSGLSTHSESDVRTEIDSYSTKLAAIKIASDAMYKYRFNKRAFVADGETGEYQLIYYDDYGTTPVATFDLLDAEGAAITNLSTQNVVVVTPEA